ncbi:unnamed protein product [Hymenolepis diminuta]|uniref:Protein FAM33A n=1 Tax=Hymenolepis diminuta TaxID=6216 RepID=A0A0R3SI84_HYMDI|nr:unnamed protein product [Hymenolepis diminuta]
MPVLCYFLDQSFRTHRSGGNRVGRSADRSTEGTANAANSEASAFVDPYQQLTELFRLLEREGNLLSLEIDDLYNQPTAAFPNKSPEVTELYRNLLIIKATSQASIKSLKQCLGGLQRDNVSNSSNTTNPTTTEVKASVATSSVGAVATNLNTTSSSLDVGSS